MNLEPPPHRRRFAAVAVILWLVVGWPDLRDVLRPEMTAAADPKPMWALAFLTFGGSLLLWARQTHSDWRSWALVGAGVVATMAMGVTDGSAVFAALFVVTSWQVATLARARTAVAWATGQSLVFLLVWRAWICAEYCLMLTLCYALSLFAIMAAQALQRESAKGRKLATANAQLRAAQALLAQNARAAERASISRELHDAWGHELTALALQLEVASHIIPDGPARDKVQAAKDLSRALLSRVRDVVGTLREVDTLDLRRSLIQLADGIPRPRIHILFPEEIELDAAVHAHALLRCAQEAVTNAVRHAEAENLWLELRWDGEGVQLLAYDDGRGADAARREGNGLAGMRERLEALGGRIAISSAPGRGFAIDAWVPAGSNQL